MTRGYLTPPSKGNKLTVHYDRTVSGDAGECQFCRKRNTCVLFYKGQHRVTFCSEFAFGEPEEVIENQLALFEVSNGNETLGASQRNCT
jgi:hypothetical protein